MAETKAAYAIKDNGSRTLDDDDQRCRYFLAGCSGPGYWPKRWWCEKWHRDPLILALQQIRSQKFPTTPLVKAVRSDAIICTGRSDFPNQVNNVLCFPFISVVRWMWGNRYQWRDETCLCTCNCCNWHWQNKMKRLANMAIKNCHCGPEYIIPKPFDPRCDLLLKLLRLLPLQKLQWIPGVWQPVQLKISPLIEHLNEFVYKTNLFMKPIFAQAKKRKTHCIGGRKITAFCMRLKN